MAEELDTSPRRKLVRDRIGDIPWSDPESKKYLGWVAPHDPEYRDLLRAKLREEVDELLEADRAGQYAGSPSTSPEGRRAVLDEVADVYEALRALLFAAGTPAVLLDASIRDAADAKLAQRGGFFEGRTYAVPEDTDG